MDRQNKGPAPWASGSLLDADPDGRAGGRRFEAREERPQRARLRDHDGRAGERWLEKPPSGDDPSWDEEFGDLVCAIRGMRDREPPADFASSVMAAVRVKKRPWWYRLHRWASAPRSFTYTPLRLAPAAFVLVMVALLPGMLLTRGDKGSILQTQRTDRISVVLNLAMPEARNVQVMGSFNGWRPQKCEVRQAGGEATWAAALLLPPGRYEYVFLVDGAKIVSDPRGDLLQDDGFGNANNVLVVGNGHEQSI